LLKLGLVLGLFFVVVKQQDPKTPTRFLNQFKQDIEVMCLPVTDADDDCFLLLELANEARKQAVVFGKRSKFSRPNCPDSFMFGLTLSDFAFLLCRERSDDRNSSVR
jgi:hypothetical protein